MPPVARCLRIAALSLGIAAISFLNSVDAQENGSRLPFYIGTYTSGTSQGIYRSELTTATGGLAKPVLVAELENPSFLTIHPTQDVLFAISEVAADSNGQTQQVFAYKIHATGGLELTHSQVALGDGPCYVSTDQTGRVLLVANYGSGSITTYLIDSDGRLSEPTSHVQHSGSSVNPKRQQGPHAHCILSDPSNKFVCAADLGLDQILVYALNVETGVITPTETSFSVEPGGGPRHLAFHPDGEHAFFLHEITSKLSSLSWDAKSGAFTHRMTLSTKPEGFSGSNSTAEVLVHPSGKFVYASNRGHDSIATFAFDASSGALSLLGHTLSGGKTPRNFRIDPSGTYLLTENQNSDSIHVFRIDPKTGALQATGHTIQVGSPCCIKFFQSR